MKNEILAERFYLFDPNMYIVMTFDVVGGAKLQPLVEAIKRAFTAFEATMSKIVLTSNGRAYYEELPTSGCTVQITQSDFDILIQDNLKNQLVIENGEMMKVYVKEENDKLSVLIVAHHLVGDGKSIIYFTERMMQEYVGETTEYQSLKLLNDNTLPEDSRVSNLYRLVANYYNRLWTKDGKVFSWSDRKKVINSYWHGINQVIMKKHISPEHVLNIRAKAKAIKVSMNSWIIAAFMKENRKYKSVNIPVNVRTDGNRTMSNQAAGIAVNYRYNDKLTFEQNAQQLQKRISKKLNKPSAKYFTLRFIQLFAPTLIDSVLMYTYGLYNNSTSRKVAALMCYAPLRATTTLTLTNLTRLDISEKYGGLRIENYYFLPPLVSHDYQTFGIATTSSGMTVTFHSISDRCTNEEKQMFDRTMDFLEI